MNIVDVPTHVQLCAGFSPRGPNGPVHTITAADAGPKVNLFLLFAQNRRSFTVTFTLTRRRFQLLWFIRMEPDRALDHALETRYSLWFHVNAQWMKRRDL